MSVYTETLSSVWIFLVSWLFSCFLDCLDINLWAARREWVQHSIKTLQPGYNTFLIALFCLWCNKLSCRSVSVSPRAVLRCRQDEGAAFTNNPTMCNLCRIVFLWNNQKINFYFSNLLIAAQYNNNITPYTFPVFSFVEWCCWNKKSLHTESADCIPQWKPHKRVPCKYFGLCFLHNCSPETENAVLLSWSCF